MFITMYVTELKLSYKVLHPCTHAINSFFSVTHYPALPLDEKIAQHVTPSISRDTCCRRKKRETQWVAVRG